MSGLELPKPTKSFRNTVKSFRNTASSNTTTKLALKSDATSSSRTNQTASKQILLKSGENVRSKVGDGKRSERWVNITNANGDDVTPKSLASTRHIHRTTNEGSSSSIDLAATPKETVSDLLNYLEVLGGASAESSGAAAGGSKSIAFAGSHLSQSTGHESMNDSDRGSESGSQYDDEAGDSSSHLVPAARIHESDFLLPGITAQVKAKEADLTKLVSLTLTESETMFLLTIPSTSVSNENAEECTLVRSQNAKYKELKSIIPNNDNYISRSMQTLSNPTKTKEVLAIGNKSVSTEVNVSKWAIYDAFHEKEKLAAIEAGLLPAETNKKELVDMESRLNNDTDMTMGTRSSLAQGSTSEIPRSRESSSSRRSSVSMRRSSVFAPETSVGSSRVSITSGINKDKPSVQTLKDDPLLMMDSTNLMEKLSLMERAIINNNFRKKALAYRNVQDDGRIEQKRVNAIIEANLETEENDDGQNEFEDKDVQKEEDVSTGFPQLRFLWFYKCELTRGRRVTYLSWNKQNEDILAVSYSDSKSLVNASAGLILVWSTKNPEWPDRVYHTDSPVTSVDFSKTNPGLLAAGFMDGSVVIYDVRKNDSTCILNGGDTTGKHRDPVWELKWVERERVVGDEQSRGETLISVSTDGRVTQWMVRKGLEYTDLMVLKRVSKQKVSSNSSSNSFIARQTGGLCFDFNTKDSNVYLVGTEDGQIHKCSSSYNEQYLSSYSAHTGPVNKVKWSPFLPHAFLSCSSDWTVRLWNQESEEEIFKFQSGKETVNDIAWSPHSSTYFGTVSSNGRLEIWDLSFSVLDPAIHHNVLDRQLTSISFATQAPLVITGDDFGAVSVYKICKGEGIASLIQEAGATDDGIINEAATLPPLDERFQSWRTEEAKRLTEIMAARVRVNDLAPAAL